MVHTHRKGQKATIAKDVSPMRNMTLDKYALSSSPRNDTFGFGSRLTVPSFSSQPSTSSASANNMKAPAQKDSSQWKYNNMVNNQRDNFNSLHFC